MIKTFAIYSEAGLRFVRIPEEEISMNVGEGEFCLEAPDNASALTHYLKDGELIAYTAEETERLLHPVPGHVWEPGTGWVDGRTLEEARAECWARIKAGREAAEFGGFEWAGGRFDSDLTSQMQIIGATQLATIVGEGFSITWTRADNSTVDLTAEEAKALGVALGMHVNSVHAKGRMLRDLADEAETISELDSISWSIDL